MHCLIQKNSSFIVGVGGTIYGMVTDIITISDIYDFGSTYGEILISC